MDYKLTEKEDCYIKLAAELAERSVVDGGGPFGAVIVKNGEIVATGVNTVTSSKDPTAHAEINAIRNACAVLDSFNLSGCEVYSSCEPCPMCLSALYWAGVGRIYYGNTKEDADGIAFSDRFIYEQINVSPKDRLIPCIHVKNDYTIKAFEMWKNKEDKIEY